MSRRVFSDHTVMKPSSPFVRSLALLLTLGVSSGCAELRARSHAREGNEYYRDGEYAAAVRKYEEAESLYPKLPVVALNKGLACRQLMVPGARTPENERAIDCALKSFTRLKELRPTDERGDQLYVQTLFDGDRYETLVSRYQRQLAKQPNSSAAVNGLIQVYSRWNRWEETLHWTVRRAEQQPQDAEAQYAVGVFIHNLLMQRGGGPDKSTYDPRPQAKNAAPPPVFGADDIAGEKRIAMADQGLAFLQKALAIRPNYRDAMIYMNLLYRQRSFALFDKPEQWQASVDAAESWRKKAMQEDGAKPAAP